MSEPQLKSVDGLTRTYLVVASAVQELPNGDLEEHTACRITLDPPAAVGELLLSLQRAQGSKPLVLEGRLQTFITSLETLGAQMIAQLPAEVRREFAKRILPDED